VGLAAVLAALAIDLVDRNDLIGVDFHTYLAAAQVGLQQGWSHIYDQGLVAMEQKRLVQSLPVQPFLSPPFVAALAAVLAPLPYDTAYVVWAVLTFSAFALALAWSSASRGVDRWVAVVGALAPWWVMHAVNLGQVVPLVAAAVVVAWRLLRDRHDVAAGLVLCLILLKPNTALLVPIAVLVAGRYRAFASFLLAAAVIGALAALALGQQGLSAYANQLFGSLPAGADNLTLHGALGVTGWAAALIRLLVVGGVLAAAFRLRHSPCRVLPLAIVGTLVVAPYLHGSDLCLLGAAAWMVWEEMPRPAWRVPIAISWVLASSFLYAAGHTLELTRWPLLEIVLLLTLVGAAWRPLTGGADLKRRAPA
jgi:hypothetical protein